VSSRTYLSVNGVLANEVGSIYEKGLRDAARRQRDFNPGTAPRTDAVPYEHQSRKLLNCRGKSVISLRIMAITSCKISRLAPVTRTASP